MPGSVGTAERRSSNQDRILTNRIVTILSGHGGEVKKADTTNLGPGGMFVATDEPFGVGDRFICKIDLGEPYKPVLSGAEVRWVNSHRGERGMGVRFLDIAEAADSLSGELPTRGPDTVRLRLDSVGPAQDAIVVERDGKELVVEMELPFVQPGATVEVGPDVAARTAEIWSVEWLEGEKDDKPRMRLWLNMEPTQAEATAEKVVEAGKAQAETQAASEEEQSWKQRAGGKARKLWQRPASMLKRKRQEPAPAEAAPEERAEAAATEPKREIEEKKTVEPAKAEPVEVEKAEPVEVEKAEPAKAEPVEVEKAEPVEVEPIEAEVEAKSETETDESERITVEVKSEAQVEEEIDEPAAEATPEEAASETAETAEDEEDEIDTTSFSPIHGALERVLGAAMLARLIALWGRVTVFAKTRIWPKLCAAGRWSRTKAITGWQWTKGRAAPAVGRAWKAVRTSKLLSRRRKQAKGEPSKVVAKLTSRARKVAAGRGKTIAVVLIVAIGIIGLASAGYGLFGNASAESDREQLQSEASQAGWTADQWEEAEPAADSSDPS